MPIALADVHFASDFETTDGKFYAYSEGTDHKISASGTGASDYSITANLSDARNSNVWHGIKAKSGSYTTRTPEYDLRIRDARNLYAVSAITRESTEEETEEVITEKESGPLVTITRTVLTDASVDVSARGDGVLSEDISIAYAGKARSLKLRELDTDGNFTLNTTLDLSGQQVFRGFSLLNETELFDRRVIMATDNETGTGPMGGI